MSKNPFEGWSEADVQAHNERVAKGKRVADDCGEAPCPEPQQGPLPVVVCDLQHQKGYSKKRLVVVTCYRTRKQDPDNGIYKWHIDALRAAGLIHDDTEEAIQFIPLQVRVKTKDEERTEITISTLEEEDEQPNLL